MVFCGIGVNWIVMFMWVIVCLFDIVIVGVMVVV